MADRGACALLELVTVGKWVLDWCSPLERKGTVPKMEPPRIRGQRWGMSAIRPWLLGQAEPLLWLLWSTQPPFRHVYTLS